MELKFYCQLFSLLETGHHRSERERLQDQSDDECKPIGTFSHLILKLGTICAILLLPIIIITK